MNFKKKIWIIIPVFGREKEIYSSLKDLFNQSYTNFQVVIIDHSIKKIDFSFITDHRVVILSHSSKLWWTGAINKGLEYVQKNKNNDDYILINNDDIELDADYLNHIAMAGSRYPDAVIGSISVNKETKVILNADYKLSLLKAKFDSIWRGRNINSIEDEFIPSDVLSGRGMLIPGSVLNLIGLFNEIDLPHYGADNEYTWRAKRKGFNVYCSKMCVVYTLSKERSVFSFRKNIRDFFFNKRKPGNLNVISKSAFSCFGKSYSIYFIAINLLRFLMSYIKQFLMSYIKQIVYIRLPQDK